MSDNMWIDFMAMSEKEQFEVLDALVSANHQHQENEKVLESRLALLEDVVGLGWHSQHCLAIYNDGPCSCEYGTALTKLEGRE